MRFFVVLMLATVLVLGVGLYRGWFTLSTGRVADQDHKYKLQVEVDTDKIKNDASAAKQKAREIGGALGGTKAIHGTLVKIELDRFTVRDKDNQSVDFDMEPASKIRRNDQDVLLSNLQVGDHVMVNYQDKDGKNLVRSVTAERAP